MIRTFHRNRRRRVEWLPMAILAAATIGCGDLSGPQDPSADQRKSELTSLSSAYVDDTLDTIRGSDDALALAAELFETHCGDCHGADGRGATGITDLTRGRFAYGASANAIRTTIRDGRVSEMPGLGGQYGELALGQIVAYVESLATGTELSDYEGRGRELYRESCVACHGDDGRGQPLLGAPDLTDDYWQHGESMMSIRLVITRGVLSECPPQGESLTPIEIELLTARVLELIQS